MSDDGLDRGGRLENSSRNRKQRSGELMSSFTMYSTEWCGYCKRLKGTLNRAGITFDEVDIETDPQAEMLVKSLNRGNATVPTLVFSDGSSMTNPSPSQVTEKLAELATAATR
jgi:mycoredoxin